MSGTNLGLLSVVFRGNVQVLLPLVITDLLATTVHGGREQDVRHILQACRLELVRETVGHFGSKRREILGKER